MLVYIYSTSIRRLPQARDVIKKRNKQKNKIEGENTHSSRHGYRSAVFSI